MSQKLAVVVTGGTGKQGGAVVKSLLERGHEVRAVTRSTESAKARELTGNDVVAILSRVTGRPFTYFQVPQDVIRQRKGEEGAKMYECFDRVGYTVDRAALHREFPDVAFHDFESWAKAQNWKTL